jgi:phosphate transport system substrate-binding protein
VRCPGVAVTACDGDAPPPAGVVRATAAAEPGTIRLAGTGAMAPLAERLARAFSTGAPGRPRVLVAESIGSGGGVRATWDGAVDLGMVSRPLNAEELRLGLTVVPVGRDVVVLAGHPDLAIEGISGDELRALHGGAQPLGNTPVTLLLRDRDESANAALDAMVPGMRALREQAYGGGRLRVLYHDDAMGEALASTRDAVGVFSLAAIQSRRLPLKVLALDGVRPSPASVADGSWKATRPLSFVMRPDRAAHVRLFLEHCASAEGRAIVAAGGY